MTRRGFYLWVFESYGFESNVLRVGETESTRLECTIEKCSQKPQVLECVVAIDTSRIGLDMYRRYRVNETYIDILWLSRPPAAILDETEVLRAADGTFLAVAGLYAAPPATGSRADAKSEKKHLAHVVGAFLAGVALATLLARRR